MFMRKLFSVTAVLLFVNLFYAQNWHHYKWNDTIKIDKNSVIFKNAFTDFKNRNNSNIYLGDLYEKEANAHVTYFYNDYANGNIYPSFYGYENYIKEILKQIIKDTSVVNKIQIYFYHSSDCNLSMDGLGNLRIYVGLFNYINDEADLAGALAHEFGHYYNNDLVTEHTSRIQQESTADFMAIKLIRNSKYTARGLANVFKSFKRFEIKADLINGINASRDYSHPDPGERLKQVKMLTKDSDNTGKKTFVVDSLKFFELKGLASQEAINISIGHLNFNEVIELSFINYLKNPSDMENLSLLNESLRRLISTDMDLEKKQFIIHAYKGKGAKQSENYKYVYDDNTSILKFLNKGLLHITSNELNKFKAQDLIDTLFVDFTTNKEALDYFSNIALKENCQPCLISKVFVGNNKQLYNQESEEKNSVFDCNTFIQSLKSNEQFSQDIYIIFPPRINTISHNPNSDTAMSSYEIFVRKSIELFKKTNNLSNVYYYQDLPFSDMHQLDFINHLTNTLVEPSLYERAILGNAHSYKNGYINLVKNQIVNKKIKLNWKNYSPELYSFFKKYQVKNVYMVNFDIYQPNISNADLYVPSSSDEVKSRSWKCKKISLTDDKANVFYEHNITMVKKSNDACISEAIEHFNWFLSYSNL